MKRSWPSPAGAVALALVLAACHEPGGLRAAERGDLGTLRARIDAGERALTLSLADAAEIAGAVASRELTQASGEDAVARVRDVRACAPELDDALASVMKRADAAGAEAAMVRLDARALSAGDVRDFASSARDGWRAVGVRGLTREKDRDARRRALVDPSPAVRRAAVRAMRDAEDATDLDVAFDAARRDPEPLVRTDAVRLMALFGRRGEDVARRLSDLYATADDAIREDIGAAWAAPGVFEHGGREALRILLASDEGPGAIAAAAAILREPRVVDPALVAAAGTELFRVIARGPRRNRLHAIAVAPLPSARRGGDLVGPALLDALEKASADDDLEVRVSALGRLVAPEVPAKERAAAVDRLLAIAGRSDDARLASRARQLLAAAGDVRVQFWTEEALHSDDASVRLTAVGALVDLGRASRAAPVLADPDVAVRTRGACALLVAARRAAPRR